MGSISFARKKHKLYIPRSLSRKEIVILNFKTFSLIIALKYDFGVVLTTVCRQQQHVQKCLCRYLTSNFAKKMKEGERESLSVCLVLLKCVEYV